MSKVSAIHLLVATLLVGSTSRLVATGPVQVAHVYVALCDNASQGIVPVPPKIGDGDKPEANLYWGCSDGLKAYFSASRRWRRLPAVAAPRPEVLERVVYQHATRPGVYLVADAWRGREIKDCLQAFVAAAAQTGREPPCTVKLRDGSEVVLPVGDEARWLGYIGHNGLMEFDIVWPNAAPRAASLPRRQAFVLCCKGDRYFARLGTPLALTTTQFMYPGAFILHDALEPVLDDRPASEIRTAAARAYAKNQKISVKAATGVFVCPEG